MDDFIGGNGYYNQPEDQTKTKKMMKIVGIFIFLLFIACIALVGVIYYIQSTELKINLDGQANSKLKNVLIFEGEKVYVPIRAFAEYVGYQSSNGDYKQYTEDTTKCYVESTNEVATFSLNSNKIHKIVLESGSNDSEYYEIAEPVKIINNQLCTTIEGAKLAFNIAMSYNAQTNTVTINTLPYLVKIFTARFQNAGIADKDASFSNQKALLYNMIIVKNEDGHYGVYTLDGKEILGTKYAKIKFIENAQEFIVTTLENKMGIMLHDATTKISPEYDDIKQIDKDNGLYLVKNNNKYGVINSKQSIIVYLEYDQIGINNSTYPEAENQYLLYNKCIPAKQNNKWCLFDKTGRKLTDLIYDDFGCSVGAKVSGDQNAKNVLLIPRYEGIVVKNGDLYGLIDSEGKLMLESVLASFYSITSTGTTTYYMTVQDIAQNVIEYIREHVRPEDTNDENNNQNETTNQETNQENNNQNEATNQETNQNQATNQASSNSEFAENNESTNTEQVSANNNNNGSNNNSINTEQVNSSPTIDETNVQQ